MTATLPAQSERTAEIRPIQMADAPEFRPLWYQGDLLRWAVMVGVGAVMCVIAWYIGSGDATFGQQIGPANLAVGGLIVAGIGHVGWLLAGRRAIGERRRLLLVDVDTASMAGVVELDGVTTEIDVIDEDGLGQGGGVVAGEGLRYFHRVDCPLAAEKEWPVVDRGQQDRVGRQACGVCCP